MIDVSDFVSCIEQARDDYLLGAIVALAIYNMKQVLWCCLEVDVVVNTASTVMHQGGAFNAASKL